MIVLKSFLRSFTPSDFIEINMDNIESLKTEIKKGNSFDDYTQGVIVLKIKGVNILTLEDFDLLLLWWWEFLCAVEDCLYQGESSFCSPEQDLEIRLRKERDDKIIISRDEVGSFELRRIEFLDCFLENGKIFYEVVNFLNPKSINMNEVDSVFQRISEV